MIEDKSKKNITTILKNYRRIAIVGLSDSPIRPSYSVARYLLHNGYTIFPVNPKYKTILKKECYPSLRSVPEPVDIVNIFRRPEKVLSVVEDSIRIKAKVIWMPSGIINKEAADLALRAGMEVVMDKCIKIEHMLHIR